MNWFRIYCRTTNTLEPKKEDFHLHTHSTYEIYCFLSGSGKYTVEGNLYDLAPHDIILIKKGESHIFNLQKSIPYKRLVVNFRPEPGLDEELEKSLMTIFNDRPIGAYNHYPAKQFPNCHWQYYLKSIAETDDHIKQQIYLCALLQELKDCFSQILTKPSVPSQNHIIDVVQYIDSNLSTPLRLNDLSERFYISVSQLNRNFKSTLGVTVGDYILTKRLLLAQDLIQLGSKPTNVFSRCGFQDYSSFFRAYKKKFGHTPSEEKQRI